MVTLYLYEPIERGAAAQVIAQLRKAGDDNITVRINSPGGDVAEGIAIYNALKPYRPTVYIDGVAASVASFIAMAGHRVIAAENALLMVHNPWTEAAGDSAQFRQLADTLDKHRDQLIGGYTRSGIGRADLLALMNAETWMNAEDALAMGFVDEIAEPLRFAAHAPECYSGYFNTPEDLLMRNNAARKPARAAAPKDPNETPPETPDTDLQTADEKAALEAFKKGLGTDAVAEAAYGAVMQNLRNRNEAISNMARPFMSTPGVQDLVLNALADPSVKVEDFGQKVIALLGKDVTPLGHVFNMDRSAHSSWATSRIGVSKPAGNDFVAAVSDALLIRAGIEIEKPHAGARDVLGMGISEVIRACVNRSGQHHAWSAGDGHRSAFRAAMSTSDFPAIMENTLGKALRTGYEAEPATFNAWTRLVTVQDFKEQSRLLLGSAPPLQKVSEGGEYHFGALDEDKALPYKVEKYGRIIQLTWEALINDDLGAFLRVTQGMGQAALRAEADLVYQTFADNAGAGPLMQDGKTLFHADHGNLTTAFTALDADALGAARVLLRRQTAFGGGVLNLAPRYLLVSPEHEQAAEILLAAAGRSLSQSSDNALVPAWMAKLELVVEARLDAGAAYLLTSPTSVDTLERAWLEEDNGPKILEEESYYVDARTYKVRHVFGQRWVDWRGAAKIPLA